MADEYEYREAPPPMHDPNDGPMITPDGTLNHPVGLNHRGQVVRNPWYTPPAAPPAPAPQRAPIDRGFVKDVALPTITDPSAPPPAAVVAPTPPSIDDQLNDLFKHWNL